MTWTCGILSPHTFYTVNLVAFVRFVDSSDSSGYITVHIFFSPLNCSDTSLTSAATGAAEEEARIGRKSNANRPTHRKSSMRIGHDWPINFVASIMPLSCPCNYLQHPLLKSTSTGWPHQIYRWYLFIQHGWLDQPVDLPTPCSPWLQDTQFIPFLLILLVEASVPFAEYMFLDPYCYSKPNKTSRDPYMYFFMDFPMWP